MLLTIRQRLEQIGTPTEPCVCCGEIMFWFGLPQFPGTRFRFQGKELDRLVESFEPFEARGDAMTETETRECYMRVMPDNRAAMRLGDKIERKNEHTR